MSRDVEFWGISVSYSSHNKLSFHILLKSEFKQGDAYGSVANRIECIAHEQGLGKCGEIVYCEVK